MLKEWMQERFAEQAKRLDVVEARQMQSDARVDEMHNQVERFATVVNRLDGLAESLEVVSRFVQRGKRAWLKVAGYLAGVIVVGNWVADHLPMFVGWFS